MARYKDKNIEISDETHKDLVIEVASYYLALETLVSNGVEFDAKYCQEMTLSFANTLAYDILGMSARPAQCLKYGLRLFFDAMTKEQPTSKVKAQQIIS
jgi:hypothetical protein